MKTSTINVTIQLDDQSVPEKISWNATGAEPGEHDSTSVLLGLWNPTAQTSMRIDLWTKQMTIPEMNIFYYQTMLGMADSFERATSNKEGADELRNIAHSFFEKLQSGG